MIYKTRKYIRTKFFLLIYSLYLPVMAIIKSILPERYIFSLNGCESALKNLFLFNCDDALDVFQSLEHTESYKSSVIRDADLLTTHTFEFLGIKKKIGKYINWTTDFKSGFAWPLIYYKDCPVYYNNPSDIVYVWELSRFQHLFTLSKAYLLTHQKKYLYEIRDQMSNWNKQNPYKMGPNWVTAMDVSIRAINWILVLCMVGNEVKKSSFYFSKVLSSLYLHGMFIENNLPLRKLKSGRYICTNHQMACLCGLIYLGFLFKETSFGEKWLYIGKSALFSEIEDQFHPEGDNFEKSTCYHRLVTEIVTSCVILLKINDYHVPDYIFRKIIKMYQFIANYTRPDGMAPQVGDTDDGRLYRLDNYFNNNLSDHNHLLELGHILFNEFRGDKLKERLQIKEENFWLCYKLIKQNKLPLFKNGKHSFIPDLCAKYPGTGFYILRDRGNYTLALAGNVGTNSIGNHSHNDVLSVEICYNKVPLIIDPGCHVYTGNLEERLLYRSVCIHNTVQIDHQEQNGIEKDKVFLMDEWAYPKVEECYQNDDHMLWQAEQFGFCKGKKKIVHKRMVLYFKKSRVPFWIIKDLLIPINCYEINRLPSAYKTMVNTRCDAYTTKLSYHLNKTRSVYQLDTMPDLKDISKFTGDYFDPVNDKNIRFKTGYKIQIENVIFLILYFSDIDTFESKLEQYKVALSYGVRSDSKKIIFQQEANCCSNLYTCIVPYA